MSVASEDAGTLAESGAECSMNVACIAKAGKVLGVQRVVGATLVREKGKFTLTLILVDVATGAELGRSSEKLSRSGLSKVAGRHAAEARVRMELLERESQLRHVELQQRMSSLTHDRLREQIESLESTGRQEEASELREELVRMQRELARNDQRRQQEDRLHALQEELERLERRLGREQPKGVR